MKKSKFLFFKLISNLCLFLAIINANSTCDFFAYQEELPEKVKKLRRF